MCYVVLMLQTNLFTFPQVQLHFMINILLLQLVEVLFFIPGLYIHTDYFRTGSSELVFTSNETMSVLVSIADDDIIEETESFTIVLSNPQPAGGVVLGIDTFTVTIIDQDFRKMQSCIIID